MSTTWHGGEPPVTPALTPLSWLLIVLRGVPLICLLVGGLLFMLLVRLVERPLFGLARPVTPYITVAVCKIALPILGLRLRVRGTPQAGPGAAVANHASWLDIFVLNASKRIYFVSKSEVAGWPGIGWLARATGTVFITRNRAQAAAQTRLFQDRLGAGHRLLFFPEGTSSDGQRLLPFKSTLFAAFFAPELRETLRIQPISIRYQAPFGRDARFYGWWGDMDFGSHMLGLLAQPRRGLATVTYHAPLEVAQFDDRKALAQACHARVLQGFVAAETDPSVKEG